MSNSGQHGIGLLTMQDYADALGGTLTVKSAPGAGTKVLLTSPFTPAPETTFEGEVTERRAVRSRAVGVAAGG